MKKVKLLIVAGVVGALILALAILPGCTQPETIVETVIETVTETVTETVEVEVEKEDILFAYVIHVPIPFTESIKRGAENAASDYGATIEVVTPSKMDTMEQIALYEAMVAKGAKGIGVVTADASAWIVPIQNATEQGVITACGNVYAEGSGSPLFAGISGYGDGIALGGALLDDPDAMALTGKVILGSCVPGLPVLDGRTDGVSEKMAENPNWEVSEVFDTKVTAAETYTFWETAYNANPDMVIGIGSCAFDLPAILKLKEKNPQMDFYFASYDLEPDALIALQTGAVNIAMGQGPYLQGYLPIMALIEHLMNGNPMADGWADPGQEIVTQANVDDFVERENNTFVEKAYYADHIAANFTPIWEKVKPWSEFRP